MRLGWSTDGMAALSGQGSRVLLSSGHSMPLVGFGTFRARDGECEDAVSDPTRTEGSLVSALHLCVLYHAICILTDALYHKEAGDSVHIGI